MNGKEITVSRSEKTRRSRFARIDNDVLQDEKLSFRARGILAFVLSKPDSWHHSAESLSRGSNEGIHAIRSALRELTAAGHSRLKKSRDKSGHVLNRWVFTESPSPENHDTASAPPDAENQHSAPGTGSPRPVQPGPGQPECGQPAPGKTALFETTGSETTVSETTKEKTTGAERPAPSVSFPWATPADLPADLQTKLAATYPDADDQADAFATIRGNELTFKARHPATDWPSVFVAAIAREDRSDSRGNKGQALFAEGNRRRRMTGAERDQAQARLGRSHEPKLTFVDAGDSGPENWQAHVDKHLPGAHATGGVSFGPWRNKSLLEQEAIRKSIAEHRTPTSDDVPWDTGAKAV